MTVPHPAHKVLAVGGAIVSSASFYSCMLEMAAVLDGPGVGMLGRGNNLGVFVTAWLIGAAVWIVATRKLRSFRWTTSTFVGGLALCAVLFVGKIGQRIMRITWTSRCEAGDVWFCYAAGGIHRHFDRRARGDELYMRGCRLGSRVASLDRTWGMLCCRRLLEDRRIDNKLRREACAGLAAICEVDRSEACSEAERLGCRSTAGAPPGRR